MKAKGLVVFTLTLVMSSFFLNRLSAQTDREMDTLASDIEIEQKLNQQVDLGLQFTDETGKKVALGSFFESEKPVVLTLVYYGCPMLCGRVMEATIKCLKEISLDIADDYQWVAVSFDPTEESELARKKKNTYVRMMHRDGADEGIHFLTSDSASVAKLAEQVGFHYRKIASTGQYAHSAGIMVLTPKGKMSKYFYGIEYKPDDVRLGLVEASDEKIGTVVDKLVLRCFMYDPLTGKYGFVVTAALEYAGILTVLILGGFILRSVLKDRKSRKNSDESDSGQEIPPVNA